MGADLIGYFAKGPRPRKFPKRAVDAAIAQAAWRINWLHRAREVIQSDDHVRLFELLADCPWADSEQQSEAPDTLDVSRIQEEIGQLLNMAGNIDDRTGEQIVREFIESWPPLFRDTAHVVDPDCPDKLLVFAGERSWGDTPTGAGFQMLTQAAVLGIAPILGVWIEAAFITLNLSSVLKGNHDDNA